MGIPLGGGGVKVRATCLNTKVGGKIWLDGNPQMVTFEFEGKSKGGGINVASSGSAKAQNTPKSRFSATNQALRQGHGNKHVLLSKLMAFSRAQGSAKVKDDCAPSTPLPLHVPSI
jgi:hypothetical protein